MGAATTIPTPITTGTTGRSAEELQELKDRLADLSGAVDELLARQRAEQPPDPPTV